MLGFSRIDLREDLGQVDESLAKLCVLACVASPMNFLGCQDSLGPSIGSVLAREGMMLAEVMAALI